MSERIEIAGEGTQAISTVAWQARADELRGRMLDDGHDPEDAASILRTAFGDITFRDAEQRSWRHDGAGWWRWDDPSWVQPAPPAELYLAKVIFDVEPELTEAEAAEAEEAEEEEGEAEPAKLDEQQPPSATGAYHQTHAVPETGMWAWATPDASTDAVALLDPWLDVELLEQRDDGWARVRCSNGWQAWVDGRSLNVGGSR